MENETVPDHVVLGARLLSHEVVEVAKASNPTDFINHRHITCCVDLSPLVKDEELNFLRLRYNEYLLQCMSEPFDLDSNLDRRQGEMETREREILNLKEEIKRAETERRNSGQLLAQEAKDHQQTVDRLEKEVAALRREISALKEGGGVGAGMRRKIKEEVDGALHDLEQLESDFELKRKKLKELESAALKKDEEILKAHQELWRIKSILDSLDQCSDSKINQLKDSITTKESELTHLRLEIEALTACKLQLQDDLENTQKEAENLKENVHEKDKIINVYKSDNQKITEELEELRQLLTKNNLVAQKEMEEAVANERHLSQQLDTAMSAEEQAQIERRLSQLEKELEQKRLVHEQTKHTCQAMESKFQMVLDSLDASEARMEVLAAEHGAVRTSNAKTIETLEQRNKEVEAALEEMKSRVDLPNYADGTGVGQAVVKGLDSVLETLKKTHENVTDNKFSRSFEDDRLQAFLSGLSAVDATLSAAEELLLKRSISTNSEIETPSAVEAAASSSKDTLFAADTETPSAEAETSPAVEETPSSLAGWFVRFYPVFLTFLFLLLVVGDRFFHVCSWNLWLPYFLFAALSFTLPHPFGAIASLLAALVVSASSFFL